MTYDEYIKLYKEWSQTGSISRKDDIEEQISAVAEALFKRLREIYLRYGQDFVDDDDYRSDRGCLSFEGCDSDIVRFYYSDRWAYGVKCMFGIDVPMKYLDAEEWKSLESRLRSSRMTQLSNMIEDKRRHLSSIQDEIAKYEEELKRLKSDKGEEQ